MPQAKAMPGQRKTETVKVKEPSQDQTEMMKQTPSEESKKEAPQKEEPQKEDTEQKTQTQALQKKTPQKKKDDMAKEQTTPKAVEMTIDLTTPNDDEFLKDQTTQKTPITLPRPKQGNTRKKVDAPSASTSSINAGSVGKIQVPAPVFMRPKPKFSFSMRRRAPALVRIQRQHDAAAAAAAASAPEQATKPDETLPQEKASSSKQPAPPCWSPPDHLLVPSAMKPRPPDCDPPEHLTKNRKLPWMRGGGQQKKKILPPTAHTEAYRAYLLSKNPPPAAKIPPMPKRLQPQEKPELPSAGIEEPPVGNYQALEKAAEMVEQKSENSASVSSKPPAADLEKTIEDPPPDDHAQKIDKTEPANLENSEKLAESHTPKVHEKKLEKKADETNDALKLDDKKPAKKKRKSAKKKTGGKKAAETIPENPKKVMRFTEALSLMAASSSQPRLKDGEQLPQWRPSP